MNINEYWIQRWKNQNTPWKRENTSSVLLYIKDNCPEILLGPVFVPLCGDSLDVDFFSSLGLETHALDLSPMALSNIICRLKKIKQSIDPEIDEKYFESTPIYKIDKTTLYLNDLFNNDLKFNGLFNTIFDRASFIATHPSSRGKYKTLLDSWLRPGGTIILEAIEKTNGKDEGPPYHLPYQDIVKMFKGYKLEILGKEEIEKLNTNVKTLRPDEVKYYCLMTKKLANINTG